MNPGPLRELVRAQVATERRRTSRRRLVATSAKVAGGGALALSVAGLPIVGRTARAQDGTPEASPTAAISLESDLDVLNYALTLELAENAFLRDNLPSFPDLGTDSFGFSVAEQVGLWASQEAIHVATLTDVVASLGGTPVEEDVYDFEEEAADEDAFLETLLAFANLAVGAYNGGGQFLSDPALLTTAGTIVSVEARHAAYMGSVLDQSPFPDAFDPALAPEEVVGELGGIVGS